VVVAIAHELRARPGRRVTLRPALEAEPARKVIFIADGARLDVRPSPGR
jgi:hypothetical protein